MAELRILGHPLVAHHLGPLRDRETPPEEFRRLVRRLATLVAYEATRDLSLEAYSVDTPLESTTAQRLVQRIGLVPILRAGLGMVEPVLELLPSAEVWHLGVYRDETTARPVEYYQKLPEADPVDVALVLDPMLATGGSASAALATLRGWGVERIKLLSIIAAPEGIAVIQRQFPEVEVIVCARDSHLNDRKFIVPGLGDAGDRTFRTADVQGAAVTARRPS